MITIFGKRETQRTVTAGIKTELPRYFTNYIWNYFDLLQSQELRLAVILSVEIQKDGRHCEIYFTQKAPYLDDHFSIELIDAATILPNLVLIEQERYYQRMLLPEEAS
ncbi:MULTISPECIES: DUF960 family protein [Loigolactobacillus]|uniref:Uncharacterized protein n=1 Tax=Loigolactobacillus backii TaxID=375175 RepID=A0A192H005_9LACO|nr:MULTISPECIES: DUF960 family protein [Loigolactobacillus]ANK60849.1 hypothetical protein AYR52_11660 [Loigolactobacillus backii]ANK61577.1 hypothetical protein AYR53_01650 [Loigolactobacillus backii]ANK65801.1 hypothetical protein AYR54_11450 [Loigolactobacillus backii]ANK68278.1 hypothetical protein AYR55_11600 [Loigolactobacillus backii]ANK69225.1 hypothetical protein AYR56_03065 [Loigolactobacillus backii]